ncbi:hypothetical protein DAPPUDRAFT_239967 [Daphnia pulex]|uniref:Coiled-coil domain-containing protein 86 n=1 Tax=Daphnia pulex TaxID=6669 RepID=E9GAI8_DAPPU|nr:hypothetical protein DAPPUDRAFT_239967 [Daphnia pulex]|eukprot:EFX83252.1 hypothetical protein DAPPUDRAFT_239967 [Daphnia pulex]
MTHQDQVHVVPPGLTKLLEVTLKQVMRKLGEGVDTLIPIREEKNEDRANPSEDKEKHILVELEEEIEDEIKNKSNEVEELNKSNQAEVDDKIIKTEVVCKTIEAEVGSKTIKTEIESKTNEAEIKSKTNEAEFDSKCNESDIEAVLPSKEIEDKITKQESPVKASKAEEMKTEDTDSHEDKLENVKLDEVDNSSLKSEIAIEIIEACKENSHSSEENHEKYFTPVSTPTNLIEVEDATKQTEKMDCTTSEEQQPLTTAEVASPKIHDGEQQQEENKCPQSPLKETNVKADSPVKSDGEKPRKKLRDEKRKMRIAHKVRVKKIEPPKESLPCGADVMRNIPRGKSKSGREWKEPKSNPRYLYQDKGLKMPFEKITQLRQERQRVKELENRMKEEERARRAEITRRREVNKKREEENARRGEVVQVIRNTNKIKRMKKKQLKLIQKRDTTKVV